MVDFNIYKENDQCYLSLKYDFWAKHKTDRKIIKCRIFIPKIDFSSKDFMILFDQNNCLFYFSKQDERQIEDCDDIDVILSQLDSFDITFGKNIISENKKPSCYPITRLCTNVKAKIEINLNILKIQIDEEYFYIY